MKLETDNNFISIYDDIKANHYIVLTILTLGAVAHSNIYILILFSLMFIFSLFRTRKLDTIKEKVLEFEKNIITNNSSETLSDLSKLKYIDKLKLYPSLNNNIYFYYLYLLIVNSLINKNLKKAQDQLIFIFENLTRSNRKRFLESFEKTKINDKKILYYLISEIKENKLSLEDLKINKEVISYFIQKGFYLEYYELSELNLTEEENDYYLKQFREHYLVKGRISSVDMFNLLNK